MDDSDSINKSTQIRRGIYAIRVLCAKKCASDSLSEDFTSKQAANEEDSSAQRES